MADYHDDVKRRLEDAGKTLMMLPMPPGAIPAGLRAAWPEVERRFHDIMAIRGVDETAEEAAARRKGQADQLNRTRLQASREAVGRLDEVLGWLLLIRVPQQRIAVAARMQVHPASGRHVHSWNSIARALHANRRTVQNWYYDGLDAIILGLTNMHKKK
jgi:hypothetical protein